MAEAFHVHRSVLNEASETLKSLVKPQRGQLSKHVRLRDDDSEAFGLAIEWLYGKNIPYYSPRMFMDGDIATGVTQVPTHKDMKVTSLPSIFDPKAADALWQEPGPEGSGVRRINSCVNHVCALEAYRSMSPEELRLVETSQSGGSHGTYLSWIYKSVVAPHQQRIYKVRKGGQRPIIPKRSQAIDYLRHEGIIDNHRACWNVRGEYLQLTLVNLLAMAEKYH